MKRRHFGGGERMARWQMSKFWMSPYPFPLLGWLFKNHRSQQQLTDLYFFVTPTLL